MIRTMFSFVIISILFFGCQKPEMEEVKEIEHIKKAVAVLHPLNGSDVSGIVYFNYEDGLVEVIADVDGLSSGEHGFHIHQYGDIRSDDGSSVGSHFNPGNTNHGGPETEERHVGDLGNIYAVNDSTAHFEQNIFVFTISGENGILGRSIVIHQNEDDFTTQPAGNSGTKVAAGVIGIANTEMYK